MVMLLFGLWFSSIMVLDAYYYYSIEVLYDVICFSGSGLGGLVEKDPLVSLAPASALSFLPDGRGSCFYPYFGDSLGYTAAASLLLYINECLLPLPPVAGL